MSDSAKSFNSEAMVEILELEETGDPGLLEGLVRDFFTSVPELFREIEKSILVKDYDTLERAAHSIKSSSSLMGLESSAEKALEIEHEANQKLFSPDKLVELKRRFEQGYGELRFFCDQRSSAK